MFASGYYNHQPPRGSLSFNLALGIQRPKRRVLVSPHETAVAVHNGSKNGGETSLHVRAPSSTRLAAVDEEIHATERVLECRLVAMSRH